jgi:ABC-type transport system involved in cytochrome c biogenesis permease component
MTLLPIVDRELRVTARRPATYWLRFGGGLGVLLIWTVINLGASRSSPPAELSQMLFIAGSLLGFVFALLAGIFLTGDCLSAEKRDGTLGLLFLTDLRGHDIVLGKLAATSLNCIYGLLTIFPVLALSLLLGGVSGAEVGRMALTLLATLFYSLALGLFVSALSRQGQRAMMTVFLVLLSSAGLLPALNAALAALTRTTFIDNPLNWLSPVYMYILAFAPVYRAHLFVGALVTHCLTAAALLGLACALLPQRWQDRPEKLGSARACRQVRSLESSFALRTNPCLWLARRRDRLPGMMLWIVLGLFLVWLVFFALVFDAHGNELGMGGTIYGAFLLHLVLKILVAIEVTRRFSDDRANGTLELLLVAPLPPRAIVEGEWSALRRRFLLPILGAILASAACIYLTQMEAAHFGNARERAVFVCTCVGGMIVLFLDVWALGGVGLEQALRHRKQARAVLATLGRIMLGPWLLIFLFIFLMFGDAINDRHVPVLIGFWFMAVVALDLVVGNRAWGRLRHSFRPLVAGEKVE